MLTKYTKSPNLKIGKNLKEFSMALKTGHFFVRRDFSLVFLCGANKSLSIPSERRKFLKSSIQKILPHTRIVYAEAVIDELVNHEKKIKNLLDVENKISEIADWIIIVLESYSSFTELGAFSTLEFRKKLIVINDSHFKNEPSFINIGPLQAIRESSEVDRILWYPMAENGINELDSIGTVLPAIIEELGKKHTRKPIQHESCLPQAKGQSALFFLHDIIYMCGPITHKETIEIYKILLGDNSYDDIGALRGILKSSELIKSKKLNGETLYQSIINETFIEFNKHYRNVLIGFRRLHLKYNPQRFNND